MKPLLYGLLAEFPGPDELRDAAGRAWRAGYRRLDAFAPYPVEDLAEAIGYHHTALPPIVLAGGVAGCVGGYYLQYYCMAVSYPLNVGSRPLNSWPMFIPVTFELTVLLASLAGVIGFLFLCRLPEIYHPVFNVQEFARRASRNGFFLCIEAGDPSFDRQATEEFLRSLGASAVWEVER